MDSVRAPGPVDKAVDILQALASRPLDLAGLQTATGLPRATAHRLAVHLEQHHLVRRDDRGRFCLGFGLIALGRAAEAAFPLADLARPALAALRDATGESVQLFVRDGEARRCVVSLQSRHALQWIVPDGALLPLEVGSAGKILRGEGSGGVAQSVEEREPGVASVSAAVCDASGSVVAAVSVSGPLERLGRSPARRVGAAIRAAADEVSRLIPR